MTYQGSKRRTKQTVAFTARRPERGLFHDAAPGSAATIIIHPDLSRVDPGQTRSLESRLSEAEGLAAAIGLDVRQTIAVPVRQIRPSTFFGKGKIGELAHIIGESGIELVFADCSLQPIQQRNLENSLNCKVIDRTGLILEIFGERAQTKEGTLQVELAHLTYQRSRLVRSWTHLERQRGGFGFMGGPGERQIEADRRLIDERITRIKKELGEVRRTRGLHRRERQKVPYPIIALVGYTNAGKSTLFNRLTGATVNSENKLFATLDPTARQVELGSGRKIIVSDTVGFVSNLPTQLIAAFRATLEEVLEADIILHVRDISDPDSAAQRDDVIAVLNEIGIGESDDRPIIEVCNKIDLTSPEERSALAQIASRRPDFIPVSALTGEGMDTLLGEIDRLLAQEERTVSLSLRPEEGEILAWLYRHGEVLHRNDSQSSTDVTVRLSDADYGRLQKIHKITAP